jgi:hypothetical protein
MTEVPPEQQPQTRRYLLNIVLFAVMATLAWAWYEIHLKVFATAAIVGTSFSAAAAISFLLARLEKFVGTRAATFFDQLMSGVTATVLFSLGIVVATFALITTSSVRLIGMITPPAGEKYEFAVERLVGNSVAETRRVTLTSDHIIEPMSFFFQFRAVRLRVVTRKPALYVPMDVQVSRGSMTEARLMTNDLLKEMHLVRVFFGKSLFHRLHDGRPNPHYKLEIYRGRTRIGLVDALQFQPLWIGGSADELEAERKLLEQDAGANKAMDALLEEYVHRPSNVDLSGQAKRRWSQTSGIVTSPSLTKEEALMARVIRDGTATADTPITVSPDQVTNVIVEGPQ